MSSTDIQTHPADVRAALVACQGDRHDAVLGLARARRRLRALRPELERAVLAAHRDGLGPTEIARLAGITRQTVYQILGDGSADDS